MNIYIYIYTYIYIYIHTGILFIHKKGGPDTGYNVNELENMMLSEISQA